MENTTEQPTGQATRNKKWQNAHASIVEALMKLIADLGRQPTYTEIQAELARKPDAKDPNKKAVSMGIDTICKHLKDYKFSAVDTELRVLTPQVLINVFRSSEKSAASQKLWFQLVENWKEGTEVTGANGTPLVPEQYDFSKLPADKLALVISLLEEVKVTPSVDANN